MRTNLQTDQLFTENRFSVPCLRPTCNFKEATRTWVVSTVAKFIRVRMIQTLKSLNTTSLQILIVDCNDETPIFDKSLYTWYISEDATIHTLLTTPTTRLTATDRDEAGDPNSQIKYNVTGSADGVFEMFTEDNGHIRTSVLLDREAQAAYSFDCIAYDQGARLFHSHGAFFELNSAIFTFRVFAILTGALCRRYFIHIVNLRINLKKSFPKREQTR